MTKAIQAGTFQLGDRPVTRMGYGAMQLSGPHVFGPPKDRAAAIAVLRAVVESGITHIDTSDYYGPHVTNQLIREALHPYPDALTIVTKVGASRGSDGSWNVASSAAELELAVHDNLRNLGLDVLDVVNFRVMFNGGAPSEGSIEEPLTALVQLQEKGLIRHIGLSNVTAKQVAQGREITRIACVQNMYNLAHRTDDALIDHLAKDGIAYVPFFPLGGFSPLQADALSHSADQCNATPMQVALAWLLQRSPNILLIPGTSSVEHLKQNIDGVDLHLPENALLLLDKIGSDNTRD
jgi:aryl-alcohol dehydrogenase-like predicted oxidoreductase